MENLMPAILILIAFPVLSIITRALYLIYNIYYTDSKLLIEENALRTILCIGSGGHTTELLRIVGKLDLEKYQPRLYVMANNDANSEVKIQNIETGSSAYAICKIPRSRNVMQSYTSSLFSTLYATIISIPVVLNFKPNVIFCNGPGTCVPICIIAFLLRCLFIIDCRIVFIESICRVRTMSLTGKILQYFADIIVVQWPQLRDVCYRGKYFGRLS